MAQTTIQFRVNSKDKEEFEKFCNETGMNVSTALNMFIKKVNTEKRIPFEISTDSFYSASNVRYLENQIKQIKKGTAKFAEHDLIEAE